MAHNRDLNYLGFKFLEISIAVFKQHKKCMHQQTKYLQNFLLEIQMAEELILGRRSFNQNLQPKP